jgi:uncharacterized protein (TIGR04255 family)
VVADGVTRLPEFADPPVNETVLSIQFAPIANFWIPHYGLYWATIRREFPRFEVHPALPSVTEQFGEPVMRQASLGIQLIKEPDVRCWFLDQGGGRLIQVQRDRFIHNWRQISGKENYPRYPSVRQTLETEWSRFCDFLRTEGLDSPQVNQCEVTYVNHIEYGRGWNGYGELNKAISLWSGAGSSNFLPSPERANMEVHYRLPSDLGRLHVSVEPVIRARDSKEVLQLTLTARGAPKSSSVTGILDWMDLGRAWVVKGFTDFTTASMHAIWGRQS